jgi:hypothetical protein
MSAPPQRARSARRAIAAAVTLGAALAAPGIADAATLKGTVVAKDAARGTVVTADRAGAVRTVRTKGAARYRVGQRVVARATARPDGTYAATRVKRLGRTGKARLRATVVKRGAGRYVVSAGSSTFAIRRRGAAAASVAATPQVGDIVVADVRLADGAAIGTRLREVGQADMVEIEGIFLDAAAGEMRIAVERRGLVTIAVPADREVTATAGDEVEVIVSVDDNGGFTLVALEGDGEDGEDGDDEGVDFDSEDGEVEIEGSIEAISPTSVTVSAGDDASVTCSVPATVSLAGFAAGDDAEMECRLVEGGAFELLSLETDEHEVEVEDADSDDDADDDEDDGDDD